MDGVLDIFSAQRLAPALELLRTGGPAIWAIAALSVGTLALILWKAWPLLRLGPWTEGRHVRYAVQFWNDRRTEGARLVVAQRRTLRA